MRQLVHIIVLVLGMQTPVQAWDYKKTNAGYPVHWASDGPSVISFQYHPDGVESIPGLKELTAIEDAMEAWNANPNSAIQLEVDGVDPDCEAFAFPGADQNCIVATHSGWAASNPGALTAFMITHLSWVPSTGHLRDVDIEINEEDWDFSLCLGDDQEGLVDFRYAFAHELGHVYGLVHPTEEECATITPTPIMCSGGFFCGTGKPASPQSDDLEGVAAIYDPDTYFSDDHHPTRSSDESTLEHNPEPVRVESDGPTAGRCSAGPDSDFGIATLLVVVVLYLGFRRYSKAFRGDMASR